MAATGFLTTPYPEEFFDWMREGSLASARIIVPMLLELAPITSVVDVGCGDGTWLSVFLRHGVTDILGVDGFEISDALLQIPHSSFIRRDLSESFVLDRRFDLAVSLEVAEHLPKKRAQEFVCDLTRLSPIVAFSAAVPGQGGSSHLNEQHQDYLAATVATQDYLPCDCIRGRVWDASDVSVWYAQNLIVYCSREKFD